jgi:indolepyruvate ferredoxin oxidoreductase beta subunit
MNLDIVLCGVGGQGILSIAYVLDNAAMEAGLHFRQPEVHGMAQRGGAVSAFVRISDKPVPSDLVPTGAAKLVVSVEPMESLRYLAHLAPDGTVVTDVTPYVNIGDYPDHGKLYDALFKVPRVLALEGERLAKKAGTAKAQNMVVLGAASVFLPFEAALLEKHIAGLFGAKGGRIVEVNHAAFRAGRAAGLLYKALVDGGANPARVGRVLARGDYTPAAPTEEDLTAWRAFFQRPDAGDRAAQIFREAKPIGVGAEAVRAL